MKTEEKDAVNPVLMRTVRSATMVDRGNAKRRDVLKIIHILPGSGGTFYCENCMRDATLVKALRRQGQDVVLVPM
jgi:hypothetical protein